GTTSADTSAGALSACAAGPATQRAWPASPISRTSARAGTAANEGAVKAIAVVAERSIWPPPRWRAPTPARSRRAGERDRSPGQVRRAAVRRAGAGDRGGALPCAARLGQALALP